MKSFRLEYLAFVCALGACSTTVTDGDQPDAGAAAPDSAVELPKPPSSESCDADQHACGSACTPLLPNQPTVGCAYGCDAPCPVPANAVATCSAGGTCDFTCMAGYTRIGGACVSPECSAVGYSCGALVDDSGTSYDCGQCKESATCGSDHRCLVSIDAKEPNQTVGTATQMGDFNDADDKNEWYPKLTIDSAGDEDWFRFHVTDGFDAGNPSADIELRWALEGFGWLTADHELTVWFKCDTEDDGGTHVSCGEWYSLEDADSLSDPTLGKGCIVNKQYLVWGRVDPSCSGTKDSGTVTVRVRRRDVPRGETYGLHLYVH